GGEAGGATQTLSYAPAFTPVFTDVGGTLTRSPEWVPMVGIVVRPSPVGITPGGCDGLMQVRLPEGYPSSGRAVAGQRTGGSALGFTVALLSQRLNDSATPVLFSAAISNSAGDPFSVQAVKQVTGDDLLVVRNGTFKYFVRATLISADAAAVAALYGVQ